MWILGIDTCTDTVNIGLLGEDAMFEERDCVPRQQLTILMPMIDKVLKKGKISMSQVELIAVTTGPGSFTGIRLGLATAKTLAQINNIKSTALNTLDVLAKACLNKGIVISSIDARKNEVFFALYENTEDKCIRISDYMRKTFEDYVEFINSLSLESLSLKNVDSYSCPPTINGTIFFRYKQKLKEKITRPFKITPEEFWTPQGSVIAAMGREAHSSGLTLNYRELHPNYMRASDAAPPKSLV